MLAINRVGSGGSVPPEALAPKGEVKPDAGKAFEVGASKGDGPPRLEGATEVRASTALDGVRQGRLDVNGYIDAKVHEATAHLSHLAPPQLETVQRVVREQLLADPHLRDLVEKATGSAAPTDE
jgi:hypothetical protein